MPSRTLDMVAGSGGYAFDPFGDYAEGRFTRNKLNDITRADQARGLAGEALTGNSNALRSLAGVDPSTYMDVSKFQSGQQADQATAEAAKQEKVLGALYAADTPEKWARTIQYLKQTGHEVDPEEEDFNNRDAIIGEAMGLMEQYKAKGSGANEMGLTQAWWQDAEGNLHSSQLSKAGGMSELQLPPGAKWLPGVQPLNAGTSFIPMNKRTGLPENVPAIPIDKAGAAAATAEGEITGKSSGSMPGMIVTAKQTIAEIDKLLADPNLGSVTGIESYLPEKALAYETGGKSTGIKRKIAQLQGAAFLSAFEMLRGGGQITEVEGQKATESQARMDAAQTDEDFVAALKDFRDAVQTGVEKLAANARQPAPDLTGGDTIFDEVGQIPEGAIVEDDQGTRYRKINGTLEAVQ